MSKDSEHPDEFRMSLFQHLEELRTRVVRSFWGVGAAMLVTMFFGKDLIAYLAVPLFRALRESGMEARVIVTSPAAPFTIYFKVALISGLILASPWVVYQIWLFIATGLYSRERKVVHILAPFSTLMTALGVLFLYYVMLPICLTFLMNFAASYGMPGGLTPSAVDKITTMSAWFAGESQQKLALPEAGPPDDPEKLQFVIPRYESDPATPQDGQAWIKMPENILKVRIGDRIMAAQLTSGSLLSPMIELGSYISFVLLMMLGIVIGFQLPVLMLVGGWVQILDPKWLGKYRKYCLFACAILGAALTPADPISMVILAVPLYLLFELGLLLARLVYRGRNETTDSVD